MVTYQSFCPTFHFLMFLQFLVVLYIEMFNMVAFNVITVHTQTLHSLNLGFNLICSNVIVFKFCNRLLCQNNGNVNLGLTGDEQCQFLFTT